MSIFQCQSVCQLQCEKEKFFTQSVVIRNVKRIEINTKFSEVEKKSLRIHKQNKELVTDSISLCYTNKLAAKVTSRKSINSEL